MRPRPQPERKCRSQRAAHPIHVTRRVAVGVDALPPAQPPRPLQGPLFWDDQISAGTRLPSVRWQQRLFEART